ncbi:hypothetical protein MMC16_003070 [Acarospora aff. strigata]|nr:hypothetical protein [Acarospora aff. strigata]
MSATGRTWTTISNSAVLPTSTDFDADTSITLHTVAVYSVSIHTVIYPIPVHTVPLHPIPIYRDTTDLVIPHCGFIYFIIGELFRNPKRPRVRGFHIDNKLRFSFADTCIPKVVVSSHINPNTTFLNYADTVHRITRPLSYSSKHLFGTANKQPRVSNGHRGNHCHNNDGLHPNWIIFLLASYPQTESYSISGAGRDAGRVLGVSVCARLCEGTGIDGTRDGMFMNISNQFRG